MGLQLKDGTAGCQKGLENWAEGSVLKLSNALKVPQHMTQRQEGKAHYSLGKYLHYWPHRG